MRNVHSDFLFVMEILKIFGDEEIMLSGKEKVPPTTKKPVFIASNINIRTLFDAFKNKMRKISICFDIIFISYVNGWKFSRIFSNTKSGEATLV